MSDTIAFGILCGVLAVAAVTDWRRGKVYNWLTYPAVLGGLGYWTIAGLAGAEQGGWFALAGLLAGIVPGAILFAIGGIGGGDAKLMGAVGAISASWQCVLATAVYALLVALVMALGVMIRRGLVKQTLSRLLGLALQTAGRVKPELPADSPRIALSVAIAIGGIVAAGEQMLDWQTPWRWMAP